MELLSRTVEIWNENPTLAPIRTVGTTDDQGFTLVISKKAEGLQKEPRRPHKVVVAPMALIILTTAALPSGPTLRTLRRTTLSDELPYLFNFS